MRLLAGLVLALSLVSPSACHEHPARRQHVHRSSSLAPRAPDCQNVRLTFFDDGLGACGDYNGPNDFIVALDASQFSLDSCSQTITITVGGKSAQAVITDRCSGCPPCGLDLSTGLFQFFADTSVGVLYGDWSYGPGSPPPSPTSSPPPPTTTSAVPTTWIPPPATSQPPTTTTPSLASATSLSSSSTAVVSTSGLGPTQTTPNIIAETTGATPGEAVGSSVLADLDLYLALFDSFLNACRTL